MKALLKIFADFNNSDRDGRVRLNTVGALNDIKRLNIQFEKGLEILLDDHEGLATHGTVEFSNEENIWVAKIDREKLMNLLPGEI
jgi:hypothetical protein